MGNKDGLSETLRPQIYRKSCRGSVGDFNAKNKNIFKR